MNKDAKDEPLAYLPPTASPENACYNPSQRTWVELTNEDIAVIDWESLVTRKDCVRAIEAKLKEKHMKTDEDDEFDRIEHETEMKSGQPYYFDIFVSPSQRNHVLEEVAKEIQKMTAFGQDTLDSFSVYIRNMKS